MRPQAKIASPSLSKPPILYPSWLREQLQIINSSQIASDADRLNLLLSLSEYAFA